MKQASNESIRKDDIIVNGEVWNLTHLTQLKSAKSYF